MNVVIYRFRMSIDINDVVDPSQVIGYHRRVYVPISKCKKIIQLSRCGLVIGNEYPIYETYNIFDGKINTVVSYREVLQRLIAFTEPRTGESNDTLSSYYVNRHNYVRYSYYNESKKYERDMILQEIFFQDEYGQNISEPKVVAKLREGVTKILERRSVEEWRRKWMQNKRLSIPTTPVTAERADKTQLPPGFENQCKKVVANTQIKTVMDTNPSVSGKTSKDREHPPQHMAYAEKVEKRIAPDPKISTHNDCRRSSQTTSRRKEKSSETFESPGKQPISKSWNNSGSRKEAFAKSEDTYAPPRGNRPIRADRPPRFRKETLEKN